MHVSIEEVATSPIKLKFRVTAREGASKKWSEKWGVTLQSHEEFHVTDQLLKLPFAERKPQTICIFSVPDGELRFRMVDADRSCQVNGADLREGLLGQGDRLELAGTVTVEVVVAPEKKMTADDRDGPTVVADLAMLQAQLKASKKSSRDEGPKLNPLGEYTLSGSHGRPIEPTQGEIPPAPRDEGDGPTLTLSPADLQQFERQKEKRVDLHRGVDRKAKAFAEPAASFGLPIKKPEAEKPIELDEAPHPKRDEGINPDRVKGDAPPTAADVRAEGALAKVKSAFHGILRRPELKEKPEEEVATRVLHPDDLSGAAEALPDGTGTGSVKGPEADDSYQAIQRKLDERLKKFAKSPAPATQPEPEPMPLPDAPIPEPTLASEAKAEIKPEPKVEAQPAPAPELFRDEEPTQVTDATRYVPTLTSAPEPQPAPVENPDDAETRFVDVRAMETSVEERAPAPAPETRKPTLPREQSAALRKLAKQADTAFSGEETRAVPAPKKSEVREKPEGIQPIEAVETKPEIQAIEISASDDLTPSKEIVEATEGLEPESDEVEPWIPEVESARSRITRRALIFGSAAAATLLVAAYGWVSWNKSEGRSPTDIPSFAPRAEPVQIEPLRQGIPVEDLRKKVDEVRRRQQRSRRS